MKHLLNFSLFLFSCFSFAKENINTFVINEDSYSLKVVTKEVTTSMGLEQLISYSVYENKKFIHSNSYGGRFFSCRQAKPKIEAINSEKGQVGWMIIGYGICGNTVSHRVELVVPVKSMWGGKSLYMSKTIIAKETPKIVPKKSGADVWFYEQNWGNGGTASSIFVPRKLVIRKDNYSSIIKKGNVFQEIEVLESQESNEWLQPNFISLFVAGIEDANPKLMNYALENYYKIEDKQWYEVYVQNGDKEALIRLIEKVKGLRELYEEVKGSVTWSLELNKSSNSDAASSTGS